MRKSVQFNLMNTSKSLRSVRTQRKIEKSLSLAFSHDPSVVYTVATKIIQQADRIFLFYLYLKTQMSQNSLVSVILQSIVSSILIENFSSIHRSVKFFRQCTRMMPFFHLPKLSNKLFFTIHYVHILTFYFLHDTPFERVTCARHDG